MTSVRKTAKRRQILEQHPAGTGQGDSMTRQTNGRPADSRGYEIRVGGRLDPRWADWFDGMTLTHADDGSTVLAGGVLDQAALHGALRKVRDLGLPLLAVTRLDPDEPHTSTSYPADPGRDAT